MSNITYILGAGASCKAMPLVSDMKQRMQILLDILNPKNTLNRAFKTVIGESCNTQLLFDKYNAIIKEANKHYTPDTYAKKLWLTGKTNELIIFKEFLNLYFIFEQDNSLTPFGAILEKIEWLGKSSQDKAAIIKKLELKKTLIEEMWDKISTPIDYRYDVFFATLLQGDPDNLTLPPNINVISWNYDNQFELAYKEYRSKSNFKEILNILKIYPCSDYIGENKQDKIIRLNGFANNYLRRRRKYNLGNDKNTLIPETQDDFDKEIDFYTLVNMLINNTEKDYSNYINFAWENKKMQINAIDISSNFIEYSNKIVIIGYSFPNFNREVDKRLFSKKNVLRLGDNSIYIQVPEEDEYLKIKERIQTMIFLSDKCFKHISDKDQFFIPL